jgi:hypothetical protein
MLHRHPRIWGGTIETNMHTVWNLVTLVIFSAICGQSAGFWPFQVFAATDEPESDASDGGVKRVAVIGMFSSIPLPETSLFDILELFFIPTFFG